MLPLQRLGVGGGVQGHDLHVDADLGQGIGEELAVGLPQRHVAHVITAGEAVGITGLGQQLLGLLQVVLVDGVIHVIGGILLGDGIGDVVGEQALGGLAHAVHADLPGAVDIQGIGDCLADPDVVKGRVAVVEAQVAIIHGEFPENLHVGVGLGGGDVHAGEVVAQIRAAGLHLNVTVAVLGDDLELHVLNGGLALHIVIIKANQLHAAADGPLTPGVRAGADVHIGPVAVGLFIALLAEHDAGGIGEVGDNGHVGLVHHDDEGPLIHRVALLQIHVIRDGLVGALPQAL